jgi:hypothetical protein
VMPPPAPDPPSTGRPRRTPSARLVDDSGLTRFVPRAEADGWSAALAVTAGQGPRSTATGFSMASSITARTRHAIIRDCFLQSTLVMASCLFLLIKPVDSP